MLWFYESFFPVVWIFFFLYWQIKATNTKATQRLEPAASRIPRTWEMAIAMPRKPVRMLASRCPGFTCSSGRLAFCPSGWELPSPSPAFCSPSGRASISAATGAAP